jgi:hypothetical protein
MTIKEVKIMSRNLPDWAESEEHVPLLANILPFATDSANYMCYYFAGPLHGRLGFLNHEESFFIEPLFRSIPAFLSDLMREARTGKNLFDYPFDTPRPEYDAEDLSITNYFVNAYLETENPIFRENFALNAIYLCPPQYIDILQTIKNNPREFLYADFSYVLRRIAEREKVAKSQF